MTRAFTCVFTKADRTLCGGGLYVTSHHYHCDLFFRRRHRQPSSRVESNWIGPRQRAVGSDHSTGCLVRPGLVILDHARAMHEMSIPINIFFEEEEEDLQMKQQIQKTKKKYLT